MTICNGDDMLPPAWTENGSRTEVSRKSEAIVRGAVRKTILQRVGPQFLGGRGCSAHSGRCRYCPRASVVVLTLPTGRLQNGYCDLITFGLPGLQVLRPTAAGS